jgi:hypothetical protein
MSENGLEKLEGDLSRKALTSDGSVQLRPFNTDNRLSPPWERRKDTSSIKLTEAYCKELEKANNLSGVGTQLLPYWARNPNAYENDDRPGEIMSDMPGSIMPKPPKGQGDFVSNGSDRVLMLRPREYIEAEVKYIRDQIDAQEKGARMNSAGEYEVNTTLFGGQDVRTMTDGDRKRYVQQLIEQNRENHLIGPTQGYSYVEAEMRQRRMSARGMGPSPDEEEKMYRKGGRSAPLTDEEYAGLMHKLSFPSANEKSVAVETQRQSGRSYNVGAGPRVAPNSSLAQVQSRAGRGGK